MLKFDQAFGLLPTGVPGGEQALELSDAGVDALGLGCDKFDWFNSGTTTTDRRASHYGHTSQVRQYATNLKVMTPLQLAEKIKDVWSRIEAPPVEDMRSMRWESGAEAAKAFTGVKPIDVDIESVGFEVATPLMNLPARAAAAYLGPYMLSLLDGLVIQENAGFPVDIMTRPHTLATMSAPNFWTDTVGPNLPPECQEVVGEVAAMIVAHRVALALTDKNVAKFERLIRAVRRALEH